MHPCHARCVNVATHPLWSQRYREDRILVLFRYHLISEFVQFWCSFGYDHKAHHNIRIKFLYTMSQKTSHLWALACYNFDTRKRILIFFGRNVTDKVSNQKRFTMPPQITCASALPGKTEKKKIAFFSLKCCISALPELSQSLLDFFSLFDSRLILTLLYDSLSLVVNAFSSGCWRNGLRERSRESRSRWTVLHAQCMCTNALSS